MTARRHSIGVPVSLHGIGLHLGRDCTLTFHPASSGSGILFRRIDLPGTPTVYARADLAVLTERHTQLGLDDAAVHTVEHVLAAVAGLEIDDIRIDLDSAEPPILDGSAQPFYDALLSAGIVDVEGEVEYLTLCVAAHRPRRELDVYGHSRADAVARCHDRFSASAHRAPVVPASCLARIFRVGAGGRAHLRLPS